MKVVEGWWKGWCPTPKLHRLGLQIVPSYAYFEEGIDVVVSMRLALLSARGRVSAMSLGHGCCAKVWGWSLCSHNSICKWVHSVPFIGEKMSFHLPTIIMVVEHPDSHQLGSSSAQLLNFIHYFTSLASSNCGDCCKNNNFGLGQLFSSCYLVRTNWGFEVMNF